MKLPSALPLTFAIVALACTTPSSAGAVPGASLATRLTGAATYNTPFTQQQLDVEASTGSLVLFPTPRPSDIGPELTALEAKLNELIIWRKTANNVSHALQISAQMTRRAVNALNCLQGGLGVPNMRCEDYSRIEWSEIPTNPGSRRPLKRFPAFLSSELGPRQRLTFYKTHFAALGDIERAMDIPRKMRQGRIDAFSNKATTQLNPGGSAPRTLQSNFDGLCTESKPGSIPKLIAAIREKKSNHACFELNKAAGLCTTATAIHVRIRTWDADITRAQAKVRHMINHYRANNCRDALPDTPPDTQIDRWTIIQSLLKVTSEPQLTSLRTPISQCLTNVSPQWNVIDQGLVDVVKFK